MSTLANGWGIMCSNVGRCRRHKTNVASFRLLLVGVVIVTLSSALLPLTTGLPLDEFYPFNLTTDNKTEQTDDGGSELIQLDVNFPFFNSPNYRGIYVNNNGIISFKEKITVYKPSNFNESNFSNTIPLIAPFWADVDIKNVQGLNESIVFRLTNESEVLNRSSDDVRRYFIGQKQFAAKQVLIVTWYQVGFYGASEGGEKKRNTFQSVLVTDGETSYAIFNYNKTVWTTGSNSGGGTSTGIGGNPAVVGFHSGTDGQYYLLDHSGTDAIINITLGSNVDVAGKYIFRIDGETIDDLHCAASDYITIEPTSVSMLGGDVVKVTGPCLTEGQVVGARIRELNLEFQCIVDSDLKAVCVTPSLFHTGELTFELNTTGMGWNYSTNITSVHLLNTAQQLTRLEPNSWYINGEWLRVQFDMDVERERTLSLVAYQHIDGKPSFKVLSDYSVSKNQAVRQFKVSTIDRSIDTLILSLCWELHQTLHPVCIWSDVFPVRWKDSVQKVRSEEWCENWLAKEKDLEPINIHAPYCPCVDTIAQNDVGHFHADPICDSSKTSVISNCTYYPNAQKCFRRNIKRSDDSGETCCYDNNGALMDVRDYSGAGTHQRYHYKAQGENIVPYFSYFVSDLLPRLHCCQYSNKNCSDFERYRNATTCQGYSPPSPALAAGDPHIVTLDGLEYSFNGVGDYFLVYDNASSLVIQVRAVQAVDSEGKKQNATVFSNVAVATVGSSDIIEIRQRSDSTQNYEVLVNKVPIVTEPSSTSEFRNISLTHNDGGNFLIVLEPVSVSVTVEVTPDLLNIIVLIGEESMKGNLRGLLGNYNNDKSDDLISRQGNQLPETSSMRTIHRQFGQTWNVSAEESILSSATGTMVEGTFDPIFIDELPSPDNITMALCEGNKLCEFDYMVTRKESVAKSTKDFGQKFDDVSKDLNQIVVRCPYLDVPENGNRTQNGSSENSVAVFSCNEGYEKLAGEDVRVCQSDSTWSGSNADYVCAKKRTPSSDSSVNWVMIGVVSAAAVFCIGLAGVVFMLYQRRKHKEPEPTTIQIHVVEGPVFADQEYYNALMSISRDGPFRVPRPHYVDPQIFTDYF